MYNFITFRACELRPEAILPIAPQRSYPRCIHGKRLWARTNRLNPCSGGHSRPHPAGFRQARHGDKSGPRHKIPTKAESLAVSEEVRFPGCFDWLTRSRGSVQYETKNDSYL
jgi:hypothetical protein